MRGASSRRRWKESHRRLLFAASPLCSVSYHSYNVKFPLFLSLLCLAHLPLSAMEKKPPLQTVPHVDLERYMGDWYVLGTIPWVVERNNVGTMDIYHLRPDGKIDITYRFHKKTLDAPPQEMKAVGRVVNTETNAEWRVRFIWPFEAPFLVIELDPDYQYTVIGYPSRDLVWIMARETTLPETTYQAILQRLAKQGYDLDRIVRVPQPTAKF